MEISVDKLVKYNKELLGVFVDFVSVLTKPRSFFEQKCGNDGDLQSLVLFVLVISACLTAFEMTLVKGIGIGFSDSGYIIAQIFTTFMLYFVYGLCFQLALVVFRVNASFLNTYKVVVYSSSWLLLMYFPAYRVQKALFDAMAKSPDVIGMGYYKSFRETMDSSPELTSANAVSFLFILVFTFWVYKGLSVSNDIGKLKAFLSAFAGCALMLVAQHFFQQQISHQLVQAFASSS